MTGYNNARNAASVEVSRSCHSAPLRPHRRACATPCRLRRRGWSGGSLCGTKPRQAGGVPMPSGGSRVQFYRLVRLATEARSDVTERRTAPPEDGCGDGALQSALFQPDQGAAPHALALWCGRNLRGLPAENGDQKRQVTHLKLARVLDAVQLALKQGGVHAAERVVQAACAQHPNTAHPTRVCALARRDEQVSLSRLLSALRRSLRRRTWRRRHARATALSVANLILGGHLHLPLCTHAALRRTITVRERLRAGWRTIWASLQTHTGYDTSP